MHQYNYSKLFKQFRTNMTYHQQQELHIQQDEKDNQVLAKIIEEFQQLKKKYSLAQNQIASLTAQVAKLKDLNKYLQASKPEKMFYSKQEPLLFNQHPHYTPYHQHPSSYLNLQQTKRKVINGFVAQLTHQLQNSQELLYKQRKIHDELRKNLSQANQDIFSLRAKNRVLQNEMSALVCENRELLGELSDIQIKKDALDSHLKHLLAEMNHSKASYLIQQKQNDEEFRLMDQIYHQIELELQS